MDSSVQLSTYHVVTESFRDDDDDHYKRIVFATRTGRARVISEGLWKLIEKQQFASIPQKITSDLLAIELLVPTGESELDIVVTRNEQAANDHDTCYVVIEPTSWCQLGCEYCGQRHTPRWLEPNHQQVLLDRIDKRMSTGAFQTLEIGWFGGEPLAGIHVIRALTPKLRQMAKRRGCHYEAKIVTNGLSLTDDRATELVSEHEIRFIEVTLDGTEQFHDMRRQQKNGLPTFSKIFGNIALLASRRDLDVEISIRCNVDEQNAEGVEPLIELLAEIGIQDRIKFYTAPVHSWGNRAHDCALPPDTYAQLEADWLARMIELGFQTSLLPGRKPIVCMAVTPNSEMIDAGGSVFNCTEVAHVPLYGQPNRFQIGDVGGPEIPARRGILGDFNNKVRQSRYLCSTCRMLPVCGGACPKQWLEGNEPCPSTKRNIEDRLFLEYAKERLGTQES